jgi:hypothetical protein
MLASSAVVNENEAWVGGDNGLAHITDKGTIVQWYDVPPLSLVRYIQFVDNKMGFLSNDQGTLFQTVDGGWNWREMPRGNGIETGPITAFYMLDRISGWIFWDYEGGHLRKVAMSQTISLPESGRYRVLMITALYFVNPNVGWAVGPGGTILKYTSTGESPTDRENSRVHIYPNPFRGGGIHIGFTLQQSQYANVQVFNTSGQRVQTLYDGWLSNGDKTFHWFPDRSASGVYFISVQCDEFHQIRKCVYVR